MLAKRLADQGDQLETLVSKLNKDRISEYGASLMEVLARMRVRTENNSIGTDIIYVNNMLVFGYNLSIGVKKQITIDDVFGAYRLDVTEHGYDVATINLNETFFNDPAFQRDFTELFSYYAKAKLQQMIVQDSKVLISFQIGDSVNEVRAFRWSISSDGKTIKYLDNRGNADIQLPPAFDFEWTRLTRNELVHGRHPHLNLNDTLYVAATNGNLVIKTSNDTNTAKGIHSESVKEKHQSIDDAIFEWAQLGSLTLIKVQPYREEGYRYLIYNKLSGKVVRMDAIGNSCVTLPSDHGIIFPGGFMLQSGEHRLFDDSNTGMRFMRMTKSPNGEDMLYTFYDRVTGEMALSRYNMIDRTVDAPIKTHGFTRMDDGRMVLFTAEKEASRTHNMQVWSSPFFSDEYAAAQPQKDTFLGRIGNADLVKGISDIYLTRKEVAATEVTMARYERLIDTTRTLFEKYHWLSSPNLKEINSILHAIIATGDAVIDEFEKVLEIRTATGKAMAEVTSKTEDLFKRVRNASWSTVQEYVQELNTMAVIRGQLMSTKELRYVDVAAVDAMLVRVNESHASLSQKTAAFIATPEALEPYEIEIKVLDDLCKEAPTVIQLNPSLEKLNGIGEGLDLLTELMTSLKLDDATQRTQVVDRISGLYATLNQVRARANQRKTQLGVGESVAQFSAQMTLFSQSIVSAVTMARTPEQCDEQLAKLMLQIQEIESQFGEHEQFLGDIITKREELADTFDSQRQRLADERQNKAQGVFDAALRIVNSLTKRTEKIKDSDTLHAFFAGDPLIVKIKELVERLRNELVDSIRADDLETRVKSIRDQAFRSMKDRADLYEGDGKSIRLGKHLFSVGDSNLDMTLLPRGDNLALHLVGTEFFEEINNPTMLELKPYWGASSISESEHIYRGEYLAIQIVKAARAGTDNLTVDILRKAIAEVDTLNTLTKDFAAPRFREGYERGIHDHDAALILRALLPLYDNAGLLRYSPKARALAMLYWKHHTQPAQPNASSPTSVIESKDKALIERAHMAATMAKVFGSTSERESLQLDLSNRMTDMCRDENLTELFNQNSDPSLFNSLTMNAALYLIDELSDTQNTLSFDTSAAGARIVASIKSAAGKDSATEGSHLVEFWNGKRPGAKAQRLKSALNWATIAAQKDAHPQDTLPFVFEAAALLLIDSFSPAHVAHSTLRSHIKGLLGQHKLISNGEMSVQIDELQDRFDLHSKVFIPNWQKYQALRSEVLDSARERIRTEEFKAKPLTSFVRNMLINEVYLPVIGDNLAKQIGTVGESKRTDQMGLLMMISPPGYGKTTLMEYVADRLGLIFMKINGPALGHTVTNLDPKTAPDSTSAKELEKLNLALEMGNNVMLYVDDIQHTSPEFLQRFISLSDGTRRIEGVWNGKTKTYDMRGKRFCIVMSGNPYTESGELFKIPDMLANRADVYNLGDVIGGREDVFKLSYIENSLTSNKVLAPMATRDLADIHMLVDKLRGKDVSSRQLSHDYSGAELRDIEATLERMLKVSEVVYRVNKQYIQSAAQADHYRVEPSFKLQGSYRNMNKLTEKITSVMNDQEMQQMLSDHYQGEAQMLTTGAEENVLKLKELRGILTEQEQARWEQIKDDFKRNQVANEGDSNHFAKIAEQMAKVASLMEAGAAFGGANSGADEIPESQQFADLSANHLAKQDELMQVWHTQMGQLIKQLIVSQESNRTSLSTIYRALVRSHEQDALQEDTAIGRFANLFENQILPTMSKEFQSSRAQQIGLHKVMGQVVTMMQSQLDMMRADLQKNGIQTTPTLPAESLEKAMSALSNSDSPTKN